MKRYIAMIMSLMIIGCSFTACGDKDSDDNSKDEKKTTVSTAEDDDDGGKDERTSEDDEEDTSEDEEDTTENEEKTTNSKGKNKLSKVYGKWQTEENDMIYLDIKGADTAWFVVDQYLSENICFDENKNLDFMGKKFTENDYEFKNGKFVLEYEGQNMLTMEKIDDSDDIFGEYKWEKSSAYDAFTKGFTNKAGSEDVDIDVFMTFEENKTIFSCHIPVDDFEIDSDTITMNSLLFGEGFSEVPYELEDDELILTNDDGKTKKFIRID